MVKNNRVIPVYAYKRELQDVGINEENAQEKEIKGWFNNIISATATVVDFGDPQINIICELNENNYKLAVNNYLVLSQTAEEVSGTPDSYHTITNVTIQSNNNTITIITEPLENELRNSYFPPNVGMYEVTGSSLNAYSIGRLGAKIQSNNVQKRYIYTDVYLDSEIGRDNGKLYFKVKDTSALGVLGGVEGSIKDLFGGEFKKGIKASNSFVIHKRQLGNPTRKFRLDTRTMTKGISFTTDTTKVVNGVAHYMTWRPDNAITDQYIWYGNTANPYVTINSLGKEYRNGSIIGKNWAGSENVLGDPKQIGASAVRQNLIREADRWNRDNTHLNVPKVSVDVDFISLRANDNLQQFSEMLKLQLGDQVIIHHRQLGIEIDSRVSGFEYNILTGYYNKLSIGNGRSNILDRLK